MYRSEAKEGEYSSSWLIPRAPVWLIWRAGVGAARRHAASQKRRNHMVWWLTPASWMALVVMCVALSTARAEVNPLMVDAIAVEADLRSRELVDDDAAMQAYIEQILDRLKPAGSHAPIRIHLLRHPAVDAFALPDGAIYVCTGLLDKIQGEADRADVIAHELAHVLGGHAERMTRDFDRLTRLMRLPPVALSRWRMSYERRLEEEADVEAAALMRSAGYDIEQPGGARAVVPSSRERDTDANGRDSARPSMIAGNRMPGARAIRDVRRFR